MHAFDHGVAMNIMFAKIQMLQNLGVQLGVGKNALVIKLSERLHNLCKTLEVKHTTCMSFVNQSIVDCLDTFISSQGNSKTPGQPMVDASDVQRLMLAMPFLLDDLASADVEAHNSTRSAADHVLDPVPEAISAVNEWLHWYQLYRQTETGM